MQEEIWKDIAGYDGLYQVSNLGRIKSFINSKEKILKSIISNNGYCRICLCKNYKIYNLPIHRIVAQSFIGEAKDKPYINHKNGIKTDNRVENLEWCTQSENTKHAYDNGLNVAINGEKHYKSKLTEKEVILILNDNRSQRVIAKDYGVKQTAIACIKQRKTWKHIIINL